MDTPAHIRNKPTAMLKDYIHNLLVELEGEHGRLAYGPHRNSEEAARARETVALIEAELKFRGKDHRNGRP